MDEICTWTETDEIDFTIWDTSCGETVGIDGSDPADIGYRFFPYCGRGLVQVPLVYDDLEEED